jgi:hypothetical protein
MTSPPGWCGRSRGFWSAALFGLLAFAYLVTEPPRIHLPSDYSPTSLVPVALLHHGDFELTRYDALLEPRAPGTMVIRPKGRWVSFYPVGAAVSALPFYVPFFLLDHAPVTLASAEHAGRLAAIAFVCGSAVLLLWVLWDLAGPGRALLLCVLYGLGTCNLSILNKGLWQHTPAELWIAGALYALARSGLGRRHLAVAGFCLGMAVFCRPSNLPFLLAAMAWTLVERRPRACGAVALGALVPAAANAAYNLAYLGSLFSTGGYARHHLTFELHPERLWGLLASPGRGLFVFVPFLLLLPFSLLRMRGAWLRLTLSMLGGFAGSLFFTSAWPIWWGGSSYGPRLLADGMPVLMLGMAALPLGRVWTALVAALGLVALAIHLLGALVVARPTSWDGVYMPHDSLDTENLWRFSRSPIVYYGRQWYRWRFDRIPADLADPDYCRGTISAESLPTVAPGSATLAWATLVNRSSATWWQVTNSAGHGEMHLSYRWIAADGEPLAHTSVRTLLLEDLAPGRSQRSPLTVRAPDQPGRFTLRVTAVVEGVRWCDEAPDRVFADLPVTVR